MLIVWKVTPNKETSIVEKYGNLYLLEVFPDGTNGPWQLWNYSVIAYIPNVMKAYLSGASGIESKEKAKALAEEYFNNEV